MDRSDRTIRSCCASAMFDPEGKQTPVAKTRSEKLAFSSCA
jgi:hypothetical protein